MNKIIVLTKYSAGNDTVGEMKTVARVFDGDLRLWQVYEQMKKLGNWDIIIPHCQDEQY